MKVTMDEMVRRLRALHKSYTGFAEEFGEEARKPGRTEAGAAQDDTMAWVFRSVADDIYGLLPESKVDYSLIKRAIEDNAAVEYAKRQAEEDWRD